MCGWELETGCAQQMAIRGAKVKDCTGKSEGEEKNVPATWARKVIDDMVWSYHTGTAPQCSDTMSGHSCD